MTETIKKFNIGFTQVCNEVLTDKSLSLKAKGLYAYLFSKPDGWEFHIDIMKDELQESKAIIRKTIKELIKAGYIIREQKNESGKFGGIIYEFISVYQKDRVRENRNTVLPHTDNKDSNNTECLNNNKYLNNIYLNNNIIIQEKENNKKEKENLDDSFAEFWLAYMPVKCDGRFVNKGSKKETYKRYIKAVRGGAKPEDILTGLKKYLAYCIKNNQLTCQACVFLSKMRWQDDFDTKTITSAKSVKLGCNDEGIPY